MLSSGMSYYTKADNQTTDIMSVQIYTGNELITNGSGITQNVSVSPSYLEDRDLWLRCCGGDVSIPSEDQGMFFSGLGPNSTESMLLEYYDAGYPYSPTRLVTDYVLCSTTNLSRPACTKHDLPDFVKPRAESAAVFLPTGDHGLVAIIGGTDISFVELTNTTISTADFVSDVPIYDVGSKTWYSVPTKGDKPPPRLAGACAVVAESEDRSMFNVYVYGGYTGMRPSIEQGYWAFKTVNTVWVLSMPSFTWFKVSDVEDNFRRHKHKCAKPYPNQMLVFGGVQDSDTYYLNAPLLRNFNLNTLSWTNDSETYNPSRWEKYKIPDMITSVVGKTANYSSEMPPEVESLFKKGYKGRMPQTWPYDGSYSAAYVRLRGLERWLGGVLGLIGYLFLSTIAFTGLVIIRRRRAFQANNIALAPDEPGSSRIVSWMHNASAHNLAQGLNINLSNLPLAGKSKGQQDEDYHPLKSPTTPYVDYSNHEDHDGDITSANPKREPSVRTFQSGYTYTDSINEDPGLPVEMRSFIDFRETDPHYPADFHGYIPGP